jgi:DNA-binding LacI/PurR family transcriptional regulator
MASAPGEPGWTQLMGAITREAYRIEQDDPHANFMFFHGVQDKDTFTRTVALLADEMRAHRLAGLILAPKTFHLVEHADLAEVHVPRVYLWASDASGLTPTVGVDSSQLIRRSLQLLKSKGRRRIAIVHMAETTLTIDHKALFTEVGLTFHRPWIQHIGRSHPEFAHDTALLLMDYPAAQRPDGLIIADDTLIQPISRGLITSGVNIVHDLELVAHCNWPWPVESVLPLTRIGFDMREIMRHAIDAIRAQRESRTPTASIKVEALFENELTAIPRR